MDLVHEDDHGVLAELSPETDVELRLIARTRTAVQGQLTQVVAGGDQIYVFRAPAEEMDRAELEAVLRVALAAVLRDACDISASGVGIR